MIIFLELKNENVVEKRADRESDDKRYFPLFEGKPQFHLPKPYTYTLSVQNNNNNIAGNAVRSPSR